MEKILLTGLPGSGKTTVAKKVAGILGGLAAGFITEEIREASGKRSGFGVRSLDGRAGDLALRREGPGPRVGAYAVDTKSFESVAIPSLSGTEGRVLIIDEIGKMECFSGRFVSLVREIFESECRMLATIPLRGGGPFIEGIRNRKDVKVFVVTRENRELLPGEISDRLRGSRS